MPYENTSLILSALRSGVCPTPSCGKPIDRHRSDVSRQNRRDLDALPLEEHPFDADACTLSSDDVMRWWNPERAVKFTATTTR